MDSSFDVEKRHYSAICNNTEASKKAIIALYLHVCEKISLQAHILELDQLYQEKLPNPKVYC